MQKSIAERDPGNCVEPGNASHYGQFTWTVALPAAPADKDSLADISKIRQFRYVAIFLCVLSCLAVETLHKHEVSGPARDVAVFGGLDCVQVRSAHWGRCRYSR